MVIADTEAVEAEAVVVDAKILVTFRVDETTSTIRTVFDLSHNRPYRWILTMFFLGYFRR